MIRSFANKETESLFQTGKSRRLPPAIVQRALMKLAALEAAHQVDDLREPPSNRLESLSGSLQGFWSIRVNEQWRIVFKFVETSAYEVAIVHYH